MNPLSEQDVRDFVSKLSTESTKVSVMFINAALGISFTIAGALTLSESGSVVVQMGAGPEFTNTGIFTTSLGALLAARPGFADAREIFKRTPAPPGLERAVPIDFTLGFTFADGSVLVLAALRDSIT
jgi:hypothetical protein